MGLGRSGWAGVCAAAFTLLGNQAAYAGDEKSCADQYSMEEQLILEWAALGGDPHAQYALAQCALPKSKSTYTPEEKAYAVKWLSIAACDSEGGVHVADRDKMTRRLRDNGDLSFRRFGGDTNGEKFSKREKKFQQYRELKRVELMKRYERLGEIVDDSERRVGKDIVVDELSRLGPIGLTRIGELSTCPYFNDSATFVAASWQAAAQSWETYALKGVYGKNEKFGSAQNEAKERTDGLTRAQLETVEFEKQRLMRTDPARLEELEKTAALGRLKDLKFIGGGMVPTGANHLAPVSGSSVTMATQYALEAMGLMEFVNGPDNDYGPSTIEAAAKAQQLYGREPTRWLSHEDVRQMVCDAATGHQDPVSYYHLGVMFSKGWGFPVDLVRARYAITRAENIMTEKLAAPGELEEWKQSAYPEFSTQIDLARTAINSAWTLRPESQKANWAGRLSDENLCQ